MSFSGVWICGPLPPGRGFAALTAQRRQRVDMRAAESNQLEQAGKPSVSSMKNVLPMQDRQLAAIDQDVDDLPDINASTGGAGGTPAGTPGCRGRRRRRPRMPCQCLPLP